MITHAIRTGTVTITTAGYGAGGTRKFSRETDERGDTFGEHRELR